MLGRFKDYLEDLKITPISWIVGVSGVLMVRFFLEALSSPTSSGYFASDASTLVHYYLFFMTGFLALLIVLPIAVPSWKNVVPQLVALSAVASFIAPAIDWIVSMGKGLKMTYVFAMPNEVIASFFTIGGQAVTLGLKIEISLGILFFGLFVYFTQKSLRRAVISSAAIYTIIFILAWLPGLISMVGQVGNLFRYEPIIFFQNSIADSSTISNNLHDSLQYSSFVRLFEVSFNFIMGKILFIISVASLFLWSYLNYKEKLKAVLINFRAERVSAYVVMILFGSFIAHRIFSGIELNWNDWLSVLTLCLSLIFSCLFAICANDMADEDTDKISNADRPLISNSLSKWDMKQMGAIFLTASLISGFLAGYTSLFFILTFTSLYYIYSVPPTRFKLIPFFSSFLISLCMLTAIMAGFFLASPFKQVSAFPDKLIAGIVIVFFLLAHVRDMKDVEGDKVANIKTVPVLFGDFWGPKIVAVFAALAFVLIPILSKIYILFIPAITTALLSWYYINKKPYSEKPLDKIYFVFMFVSFLLLFV